MAVGRPNSPHGPVQLEVARITRVRIRYALVHVVAVREVQPLRWRKVTTRKCCVATVATRPATQSPVIGGDYKAGFFDLLFRQYRRRTVRQLEHRCYAVAR